MWTCNYAFPLQNNNGNRYLGNLKDFALVGDKMYVEVKEVDEEGRLALSYVAREKDRPKPLNRRQRRSTERGESAPAGAGEFCYRKAFSRRVLFRQSAAVLHL